MSNKLLGKAQESLQEIHRQLQGSPAQRPYTGYFGSIAARCGIPLLMSEMCCLSSARRLRACRSWCRSTQPCAVLQILSRLPATTVQGSCITSEERCLSPQHPFSGPRLHPRRPDLFLPTHHGRANSSFSPQWDVVELKDGADVVLLYQIYA